jgi:hypothetical protein
MAIFFPLRSLALLEETPPGGKGAFPRADGSTCGQALPRCVRGPPCRPPPPPCIPSLVQSGDPAPPASCIRQLISGTCAGSVAGLRSARCSHPGAFLCLSSLTTGDLRPWRRRSTWSSTWIGVPPR